MVCMCEDQYKLISDAIDNLAAVIAVKPVTKPITLHDYYAANCLTVLAHPEVHAIGLIGDTIPGVHPPLEDIAERLGLFAAEFARSAITERNRLNGLGLIVEPS